MNKTIVLYPVRWIKGFIRDLVRNEVVKQGTECHSIVPTLAKIPDVYMLKLEHMVSSF